ncbi:MAG: hypothetical protein NTW75_15275 [Planctomycetales bacterium]|nr:hypothetical protein [Planctomycetales bacterium]
MKKHPNPTASDQTQATVARTGTTLSEVLVSMLIMSIGVVSLAALFPISVLRTAQATQLTHSVFLRNNAEAAVEFKGLLSNNHIYYLSLGADDQPGVAGLDDNNDGTFDNESETWLLGTDDKNLLLGDDRQPGFAGVDDDNDGTIDNFGETGWLGTDDKNLVLGIIDPLGVQFVGTPKESRSGIGFGTPLGRVRRTDGLSLPPLLNPTNQQLALRLADRLALSETLATLPDSWSLVLEEPVTATNLGGSPPTISVATTGFNVRNNQDPSNASHRMVLFDASGKFAVVQPLYQVTGLNLSWWNVNTSSGASLPGPSLPTGFTPTRVRIEAQERRYTWMMTFRKRWVPDGPLLGADGQPGVSGIDDDGMHGPDDIGELRYAGSDDDPNWVAELDVAVFYNRSFLAADENTYALTFPVSLNAAGSLLMGSRTGFDGQPGVSGVDDDNSGGPPDVGTGESRFPGSDDNRTVIVTFSAGAKPYLKKGGYMLEPTQLKWYRILDLKDGAAANTTVLLLDQDLQYPPPPAGDTLVPNIQGIFMKGIIEVYPLGSRTGRE